jgi:hypothetical protein
MSFENGNYSTDNFGRGITNQKRFGFPLIRAKFQGGWIGLGGCQMD